jgi:hypothetical protein
MAKTLEKVTKDFNALVDQLGDVEHEVDVIENNYLQLQALAREAARQAGQAAVQLRSTGHAGKSLDDFRTAAEVKKLLNLWDKQRSTVSQLMPAAKKVAKDFPPLFAKLKAMAKELQDEVANRDKKANRAIFKIKSESLPDLKKLLKEMEKSVTHYEEKVVDRAAEMPTFVGEFDPTFESLFNEEFKKAGKERLEDEQSDLGRAAKNVRVQIKYLREGRQMEAEIKQLCIEAAQAAKRGDSPKTYLDSAAKIYRQMSDVAKIQQKLLGTMNPRNLTGDGKKVFDSATAYVNLSKQTLTLMTKTTSATMGSVKTKTPPPVPSRKGKEKVDT